MSSKYAEQTKVPVSRSRDEIEDTLRRYGVTAFAFGWASNSNAMIQFEYRGRNVKMEVNLPKGDPESVAYQRSERQRWRVLVLFVKAQLEAVEVGIASFEEVFLPWTLLADGSTVAQKMVPQLPAMTPLRQLREVNG